MITEWEKKEKSASREGEKGLPIVTEMMLKKEKKCPCIRPSP